MKGQRASEVKTARKPTTHFSLSYPPYIRDHISDGEPSPAKAEIKLAEPTYLRPTSERNKKENGLWWWSSGQRARLLF